MGPLLSIIIPIYNVEKYLKQCIDSVRNQTYQNLEIILVDDGASDDSGAICDEYASTDRRIKVIHKINAGQAEARNTGLEVATGDYITFVDSDDWLDLNLYESIMTAIPFQIAIFGCTFVNAENGSCSCIKAVDRAENYCVNQFEIIQKLVNSSLLGYVTIKYMPQRFCLELDLQMYFFEKI